MGWSVIWWDIALVGCISLAVGSWNTKAHSCNISPYYTPPHAIIYIYYNIIYIIMPTGIFRLQWCHFRPICSGDSFVANTRNICECVAGGRARNGSRQLPCGETAEVEVWWVHFALFHHSCGIVARKCLGSLKPIFEVHECTQCCNNNSESGRGYQSKLPLCWRYCHTCVWWLSRFEDTIIWLYSALKIFHFVQF